MASTRSVSLEDRSPGVGQTTFYIGGLSPERDCSHKRAVSALSRAIEY